MKLLRVGFTFLLIIYLCPSNIFAQIISCPAVLADPASFESACVGDQVFLDIFIDDEDLGHVIWTLPDDTTVEGFALAYDVPQLDACNHSQVISWVLVCDDLGNVDAGSSTINTFVLPSEVSSDGCQIELVGGDCPDLVVTGGNSEDGNIYNAEVGESGTVTFDIVNTAAPEGCASGVQLSESFECEEATVAPGTIELKVFLEGYLLSDGTMKTDLANNGLLPEQQPYNVFPFYYFGMESIDMPMDNIVDWLFVELRNAENPDMLVERKALLLRNDGAIVDTDGNPAVVWNNVGSYHVIIKHRSHLGIQTAQPIDNAAGVLYDFSTAVDQAAGLEQQSQNGDVAAMLTGDYDGSGTINFFDFILWINDNNVFDVYNPADGDGNGTINFFDFIRYLQNINKVAVPSIS